MVRCRQRHLQVLHTLPRMLDAIGDHSIHVTSQPWKTAPEPAPETIRSGETTTFTIGCVLWRIVCLCIHISYTILYLYTYGGGVYEYMIMCVYRKICMEKVNSWTMRIYGTLRLCSSPKMAWWVLGCHSLSMASSIFIETQESWDRGSINIG